MSADADNISGHDDQLLRSLTSSSSKTRINSLNSLCETITQDELPAERLPLVLRLLFQSHAYYTDRDSRKAARKCLQALYDSPTHSGVYLKRMLAAIKNEAQKPGIAASSAFVLLEWTNDLLPRIARDLDTKASEFSDVVIATVHLLNNCLATDHAKKSLQTQTLRSTRRCLRGAFAGNNFAAVIEALIKQLTVKGSSSTATHSLLIGIVCGVSARLEKAKPVLEDLKKDIYAFYVREILGSKTALPSHVVIAWDDFVSNFTTTEDFIADLVQPLERGLLRSPEVLLNGPIQQLFGSLPQEADISKPFHEKLLKQLLACVKSTNALIRNMATSAFQVGVRRCRTPEIVEKIASEITTPLKTGKVASAEHRMFYSMMLETIPSTPQLAKTIPPTLVTVIGKEPNEATLAKEVNAVVHHLFTGFTAEDFAVEKTIVELVKKGLTDKRPVAKRLWFLEIGEMLWKQSSSPSAGLMQFVKDIIGTMLDVFNDVYENTLPSVQSGVITAGYITTALVLERLAHWNDDELLGLLKKAKVGQKALSTTSKLPFLISSKAYGKLTSQQDQTWAIRALHATSPSVIYDHEHGDLWAIAYLYFITSPAVTPHARQEAAKSLTTAYLRHPENIGKIILGGLWQWLRRLELDGRSAPDVSVVEYAQKNGGSRIKHAVHAITISDTADSGGFEDGVLLDEEMVKNQLVSLAVACHHGLISGVDWIALCQKVKIDPGRLASQMSARLINEIKMYTGLSGESPYIRDAALRTAATLAFVAPESTKSLVTLIQGDLNPELLKNIGPTEIGIWKTAPGTTFVDVLSKGGTLQVDKKGKDAKTLQWEAELRAQLAQKKGTEKKLTPQEKAAVDAQLKKEEEIRNRVKEIELRLNRGVGLISSLATGAPTAVELWMYQGVKALLDCLAAGAGMIIGDAGVKAYLACADHISNRLGNMRPFIGIATLRALEIAELSPEVQVEPLGELSMRILYRLRMAGEQRPFDVTSLFYIVPFLVLLMRQGGIGAKSVDDLDEQVVLGLDFLTFHTEVFSSPLLPRAEILEMLVFAMQKYSAHYKAVKDCFLDLCRCISTTIDAQETAVLIDGTISPEVSVRTATLQAIDSEIDLSDMEFSEKIWIACHDEVDENRELALSIWDSTPLETKEDSALAMIPYLSSQDKQLRGAAARALAEAVENHSSVNPQVLDALITLYREKAKPPAPQVDKFGLTRNVEIKDPWEARHGVALALKELADVFEGTKLLEFSRFLIEEGPLADKNDTVRDAMIDAATAIISSKGAKHVEELMEVFETTLAAPDDGSETHDKINEAVIILYGSLGRHLGTGDKRIAKVVDRLLATLSVPSETVQYAVAQCLPPLIKASRDKASGYVQQMLNELFNAKAYAARRGAAYGLAGIVKGCGIGSLKEYRIMTSLKAAIEDKKSTSSRQGALFAFELLSAILGRMFEPYVIQILPLLLSSFGDTVIDVREACSDAAKVCFSSLSSYGVKVILPDLLEGLEDDAWRSKKGACETLGAFAYLAPHQLAVSLPEIIPPLTTVLNDSHKEVRAAANRSLKKFGDVIENPEIKEVTNILLKALSDPTKYTDDALDALLKINFVHYLDSPSLALVVRVLERGLADRSATKRKASQIIGSLAHLTDRKDIMVHINILVSGLKQAIVDPVPATRATASKALGSLVEKLGEDALPDIIPGLMATLKSDTGAGDRLGSAQALSEVLSGLGTQRLEETLPTILQNAGSSKPAVREGFMSLFIFLPACFGNSFSAYLSKIIPPILSGLADDVESIRETSLRAGRLLVKNFATRAIDLLLPELERGLADINHRIRLSSVELVGDLLFNLTGISGKQEQEESEFASGEVSSSLLEILGQEKRDKVLSALYICRCDTSGQVRLAAVAVWKALVSSPRTLKELVPTLTQLIIRRLASSNMEQRVIAGQALGELIRKAGEGVLSTLLPSLDQGLQNATDSDSKQGICIALKELIASTAVESLEEYESTLESIVQRALVDADDEVREAAAEAFDSLQRVFGNKVINKVLPNLLTLLQDAREADNALAALLTLLSEQTRSNTILPRLVPTLITQPVSAFNAKALASLSEVSGTSLNRSIPRILNALMDTIINSKDEELVSELKSAFLTVITCVDEYDGLNVMMSEMLKLAKHDDHRVRAVACEIFSRFFAETDLDYSRYTQDCIRVLLMAFSDPDSTVVKNAWNALNELTKKLRKEEMETLVISTRNVLQQVGTPGHNLAGFGLPKGINAILPIFLQGLMYGSPEQRTQSALAISDIVDRASGDSLRPFVTQITGPLIRVVSERSVEVKAAILLTLNNLLQKIPVHLKPFLPQLQRTFAKSLADTGSELLRTRAAKALGTLITLTPRIDPLISELVTGAKTTDPGVKDAMLKALYEVVSKAGKNMGDASKSGLLALIEEDLDENDDKNAIAGARLLGVLVRHLSKEDAARSIKSRALNHSYNKASVLGLNAVLLETPEALAESPFLEETPQIIAAGIAHKTPFVSDNCVLAAGKYLLSETLTKSFESTKTVLEALASATKSPASGSTDTKRLSLVVIRTVSREHSELTKAHLPLLAPAVFSCVRDMIIPVKLSAEQAFIALFEVSDKGEAVFEKFIATVEGPLKRSMNDYFKRVGLKLAAAEKDRIEAGGAGLGLNSDEEEDMREIMSVGKVDLEDTWGNDA
ncbi:ARM repeat-containing protein [Ascodesmis nigricans]|uniref:eIF-2-alpha kinase activator GCN1 n=1 Tax=Ascodesmis nigricans TaxID=341454 RepID=A0A4S2MXH7_9PEZI|nr:ARM repeat-containing protein [Ascodesmis nigricans]